MPKANFQNFQRFAPVDLNINGDAEATMPSLIEAVKAEMTAAHKSKFEARGRSSRAWSSARSRSA